MCKRVIPLMLLLSCLATEAIAANSGGTAISEFTGPVNAIVATITGPVGKGVAIIAMAVCGVMLFWRNEDISSGVKNLLSVVFAISFIAFAGGIIDTLFTFSGAVI